MPQRIKGFILTSSCFLYIPLMASCSTTYSRNAAQETTILRCEPVIKYSGYKVEVSAIKLPAGNSRMIDIGKIFVSQEKIQEAQGLTQALDVLQFNQCQTMLLLPIGQRKTYIDRREKTLETLTRTLLKIDGARNPADYEDALQEAKKTNTSADD